MAFALLGKLLDIEWMLRLDEERPSAELARRDRELLGGALPASPERALELWLEARRREHDGRTLGLRATELLAALHVSLVALSALAGAGAAQALLRGPTAREPTNVLSFVLATLIWPLALLAGSLSLVLLRGRLGRSVLLEDLYLVGLDALGRLWRRARAGAGEDVAQQWRALRRGARRYRDLEVAALLSAAQWYPIAFHAGAALALAAAALFSDLAFAWSTTNDSLSPATLAAVFRVAAAPWCETFGVGCVSPELVEATRFSRFTGAYAAPNGALVSGAWWPALLGCLLLYGVLPRLVLSLALGVVVRRRSATLAERVLELRGRLSGVTVGVSRSDPTPDGVAPAAPAAPAAPPRRAQAGWVIGWRGAALDEADLRTVCERLGLVVERRDAAGDGDFEHDEALLRAPASAAAVLLLADGWEAPDKATRRFIEELRRGSDRPVFVGVLLEAEGTPALAVWRDRLGLLADPRVSVEAVVPSRRARREEARA
jgi:uncharacterized protein DUF2868